MHRAGIALLWLLAVAPAAAQSDALPLQLAWTAPAGCPSAAEVRAELTRIARARSGYSLRPLAADAQVVRSAGGFRVLLHTEHEGRSGERALEAGDCSTLVRSVTLVLALAFGPAVELAPEPSPRGAASARPRQLNPAASAVPRGGAYAPPTRESDPARGKRDPASARGSDRDVTSAADSRAPFESNGSASGGASTSTRTSDAAAARHRGVAPAADSGAPVESNASTGDREPASARGGEPASAHDDLAAAGGDTATAGGGDVFGLGVVFAGLGMTGVFPSPALAGAAGVQLRFKKLALEARALLMPSASTELSATIGADFRALGGSLLACRLGFVAEAFELAACAGARVLSITARASGAVAPESATAPWTALSATAFASWPRRSWLQLRFELGVSLSLSRPRFIVESFGDAQRVALFVPELGLSVLLRL